MTDNRAPMTAAPTRELAALRALHERAHEADKRLRQMAKDQPGRASHLNSKAEGVRLVMGYIGEMRSTPPADANAPGLRAGVEALRALHEPTSVFPRRCKCDSEPWPCSTIAIVDAHFPALATQPDKTPRTPPYSVAGSPSRGPVEQATVLGTVYGQPDKAEGEA